jgi:hypothetical protein
LHAHARIGNWSGGLVTDVLLRLFVEFARVVKSRSDFIGVTNEFSVTWEVQSITIVVTLRVSTAVSLATASINFHTSVLVWFTWGWGDAWSGNSRANFFVIQTLA